MRAEDVGENSSSLKHITIDIQLLLGLLLGLMIWSVGCSGEKMAVPEKALETVEVNTPPDYDPSGDLQAAPEVLALSGILPGDFPQDVPLYLPSSLVDYGRNEAGRRFVELLSPHSRRRVTHELESLFDAAGWKLTKAAGAGSSRQTLSRGAVRLDVRIEDGSPGTRYVFEY